MKNKFVDYYIKGCYHCDHCSFCWDDYDEYIHSILDSGDKLAILVKRADMKDHFMQAETLTDKLRDKYLPVVGLFL